MLAGIDTGGTFTDCLMFVGDEVRVHKRLSTPDDPARAVLAGLKALGPEVELLIHGTTVATNALLERKGARVTLLITAGFRDLLLIGRQNRQALYDFDVTRPAPLYQQVCEVQERIGADGEVLIALSEAEIQRLLAAIPPDTEAIALCLLFGYAWPGHEKALAAALRAAGWTVSVAHEVLPVYREVERFGTTVANAFLQPVMQAYMQRLSQGLADLPCRLMQSGGGSLSPELVARLPVRCALSGPAGGVIGALELGQRLGRHKLLSFDMGGTSTDVALIDGGLPLRTDAAIGGAPLALPMLDIHTVGAGGGSLARLDAGGALRVGPASAGADPGPMCYGRGRELTVTDANVLLGRIPADSRLGGELALTVAPLAEAFAALGANLGCEPEAAAMGVLAVANASMERALRVVSVERGHDPADYALFCFGGAGGLHACDLALSLKISTVIVPAYAGVFSAFGILFADQIEDSSQTVLGRLGLDEAALDAAFAGMAAQLDAVPASRLEAELELRYAGQSFEITVPWTGSAAEARASFHARHEQLHGYSRPQSPIELVTLRQRRIVPARRPELPALTMPAAAARPRQLRVWIDGWQEIPAWQRTELAPGQVLAGPALVLEDTATLLIRPEFSARVDAYGHLILTCVSASPAPLAEAAEAQASPADCDGMNE